MTSYFFKKQTFGCFSKYLIDRVPFNLLGIKLNTKKIKRKSKLSQNIVVFQSLSHIQLFCDPVNCNPPGSSVHGISQARILEWIAISFSRGSFKPRDGTQVSCLAGKFFTTGPPEKSQLKYGGSQPEQKFYVVQYRVCIGKRVVGDKAGLVKRKELEDSLLKQNLMKSNPKMELF